MKLKNDQHYLPQLSILKWMMMDSISLCCASILPRPLPRLVAEAAISTSPLSLLIEASSIQNSLLEGSN